VNECIYAVGGEPNSGGVTNTVEQYNPLSDSWVFRSPLSVARSHIGVTAMDGKVYAVGGAYSGGTLGTTEVYDPLSDSWSMLAPMLTPRSGAAVLSADGLIYAIGGEGGGFASRYVVEAYNPSTDSWIPRASLLVARAKPAGCVFDGKIRVLGGSGQSGSVGAVEEYDPLVNAWSMKQGITDRDGLTVFVLFGRLYAAGGFTWAPGSNAYLSTVEMYDPGVVTLYAHRKN
jgi:N-acetylneuraminic acid mutarotase